MFLFVPSGDKTRTQSMVSIVFVVVVVLVFIDKHSAKRK